MTKVSQGNRLSILLLALPIVALAVVFTNKFHMPVSQPSYLMVAALASALSFMVMWWLGFHGVQMDRTLWGVAAFMFVLWMIAGIAFVGWLNQAADASETTTEYRKIVRKHYSSGGGFVGQAKSSPSCMVWVDTPVADTDVVILRADYCDLIGDDNDGVMLTLKQGRFGMPWLQDYSLIRNYELYRQRLGV